MALIELHSRDVIAAWLRRDPGAHAYELGDLDDFEWPHTAWFGWQINGTLSQVGLLYTQPTVPVLIVIAPRSLGAATLLVSSVRDALPANVYVHVTADLLETLRERYDVVDSAAHLKLALRDTSSLDRHSLPVDVLSDADLEDITTLYAEAYPETWFDARMLATGRYVGIRESGRLVCIAGVHVHSPTWGVAALGNVATLPGRRGHGLARGACAALCRLLREDGVQTIALNVAADNAAAIATYTTLGFDTVAHYTEGRLVARDR